jgi:hypothetical protein
MGGPYAMIAVAVLARGWDKRGESLEELQGREVQRGAPVRQGSGWCVEQAGYFAVGPTQAVQGQRRSGRVAHEAFEAGAVPRFEANRSVYREPSPVVPVAHLLGGVGLEPTPACEALEHAPTHRGFGGRHVGVAQAERFVELGVVPKFRRYLLVVLWGVCLSVLGLLALETLYRLQIVDAYAPELRAHNRPQDLVGRPGMPALLAMGDSFTAGSRSYPSLLRRCQDRYRVINGGISGTGVLESLLVAPRRFEAIQPALFLYQIYIGNDLINIRYPVSWSTVSPLRNLYWELSRVLRSLIYLNYRLGQLSASKTHPLPFLPQGQLEQIARTGGDGPFRASAYAAREKVYLAADPGLLEEQVLARGGRAPDYWVFLQGLDKLLRYCEAPSCRAYVLVVPHAVQTAAHYLEDMQALGAKFSDVDAISSDPSPFLEGVRRYLKKMGLGEVVVLDPLPVLRAEEQKQRRVFYQNDPHLNPYGQTVLGGFLCREIDWGTAADPLYTRGGPSGDAQEFRDR